MKESKFISYNYGQKDLKNWIILEKEFDFINQGKFESIFSFGNGYIGSRSSLEESYPGKRPGTFVSSTFNTVQGPEVPELPNSPDLFEIDLFLSGEIFNQLVGKVKNYKRYLNIKDATITRQLEWTSKQNKIYNLKFEKFISMKNKHLLHQKLTVISQQDDSIKIKAGINAQMTSSGAQHFEDTNSTFLDNVLNYTLKTTQSNITFVVNKKLNIYINGKEINPSYRLSSVYGYARRTLKQVVNNIEVKKGDILEFEWISSINTTRDLEHEGIEVEKLIENCHSEIIKESKTKFNNHLKNNQKEWNLIWDKWLINVETKNEWDILSIRWALYQTRKFSPMHDYRANIDSKSFSGEEYKGHAFWDTEIYVFPYYLYHHPEYARKLLESRYFVRKSGYVKAKEHGEEGLFWPWETTWKTDGEACPTWGAVDRIEGKRIKVWPAFNQLHIGGCIGWAINQYHQVTGDQDFMNKFGYELLFENSKYWINRFELNSDLDRYEISKVTGPNEYKENVSNNAFTNYMAWNVISSSKKHIENLKNNNSKLYKQLNKKFNIEELHKGIIKILDKVYLPKPNKNGIIPENDTFLKLKEIDVSFYKKNQNQLWLDYTFPQMNDYQTLKQADIVALFYTMGHLFNRDIIKKNWKYYEDRTLHHSSLSYCMHSVTANYADDLNIAYEFFQKSIQLDIGENMDSCDNGVHAANTTGIIKSVTEGFAGIKSLNGKLFIEPNLPKVWNSINFSFWFKGQNIHYNLENGLLVLRKKNKNILSLEINQKEYNLSEKLEVKI